VSHVVDGQRILAPGESIEVAAHLEAAVVAAALECPEEIIAVFTA
jgi:hypothetical protein